MYAEYYPQPLNSKTKLLWIGYSCGQNHRGAPTSTLLVRLVLKAGGKLSASKLPMHEGLVCKDAKNWSLLGYPKHEVPNSNKSPRKDKRFENDCPERKPLITAGIYRPAI